MPSPTVDADKALALAQATENIEALRAQYEHSSKVKKYEYLAAVAEAKEKFGTTNVAKALGVTRHRVYQILNEARDLRQELGL